MNEPTDTDQPALTFAAPAGTTEATGIVSFEARLIPSEVAISLVAFTADHQQAAEFRTQLDQTGGFTSIISRDGSQIESELRGEVTTTGQVNLRGCIGRQEFQISGSVTDSHRFEAPSVDLSDEHRYLLQPWMGLTSSLQALTPTTHGCQGCLLLGATLTQSAYSCVGGDPAACSVLLDSYTLFQSACVPPPCT